MLLGEETRLDLLAFGQDLVDPLHGPVLIVLEAEGDEGLVHLLRVNRREVELNLLVVEIFASLVALQVLLLEA